MQALTSIGSFLSTNASKLIPAGLAGGSFLSNWLNNRKMNERQNFLESLSKDPNKMNAYVSKFSKPLDRGLTTNVENQVQAVLGEKGLSSSPTITADVLAQALGPYQQQEQQMGINEAISSLGMMPTTTPPPSDPSMALMMLMQNMKKSGGGSGSTPTSGSTADPFAGGGYTNPDATSVDYSTLFDPSTLAGVV